MQFLKILFWCLLAFVAALFTYGNWGSVPIKLSSNVIAQVNLPVLLLFTFLVGLLPTLAYQHAMRWRLRQRLATAERTLAEVRATVAPPAIVEPSALPAASSTAPPLVT